MLFVVCIDNCDRVLSYYYYYTIIIIIIIQACEIRKENETFANKWYHKQLLRSSFSFWVQYVTDLCIQEWQQEETALEHYNR